MIRTETPRDRFASARGRGGNARGIPFGRAACREAVPTRGVADSRIRYAPYNGDQVYRVRGFVGYQIDFEFEAGESFVGLGAGDMEGISYFGTGNHLFLKPKAAKVATNLTVLTNRRRYQIDYTAAAQRPGPEDPDVMFAVRFTYPPNAARTAGRTGRRAYRYGTHRCLRQAAAEFRLLVLRQPNAQARRRIGRRGAYAPAIRRKRRAPRDFRAQRATPASRC